MNIFRVSYTRFWVRFAKNQAKTSVLSKTRWAVHDKAIFEGLINDLKDLIDNLNKVLPVDRVSQDRLVRRDISSILDIANLRLVRWACKSSYRSWSDEASKAIEASEIGTMDRRNVEEWIRDTVGIENLTNGQPALVSQQTFLSQNDMKHPEVIHNAAASDILLSRFNVILNPNTKLYLIHVGKCPGLLSDQPCKQVKLGELVFEDKVLSHDVTSTRQGCISRRVLDTIRLSDFTTYDLDDMASSVNMQDKLQSQMFTSKLPLAKMYIYCAPCAYQIRTALNFGYRNDIDKLLKIVVRPHLGLAATCCHNVNRADGLTSLLEKMDDFESSRNLRIINSVDAESLDRLWIERRLYQIEEEMNQTKHIPHVSIAVQQIFEHHKSDDTCAGIVIIGETDQIQSILHTPPFPTSARMPREREIYQLFSQYENGWVWKQDFLGTYAERKPRPSTASTVTRVASISSVLTQTRVESLSSGRSLSPLPGPSSKRPRIIASGSEKGEDEDEPELIEN